MKKINILLAAACLITALLTGCNDSSSVPGGPTTPPVTEPTTEYSKDTNPVVTIEMEYGGIIKIELYPDVAPNTVNNFISLVQSGFYNGLVFHRTVADFMIQGGSPNGNGSGGPGYSIKGEFSINDFENNLSHTRGVISMARGASEETPDPYWDSAGSQFFIVHGDSDFLDTKYAAFGKVIQGMNEVDYIANRPVMADGETAVSKLVMKKVTVDTKGITYPAPEKLPAM